MSLAVQSLLRLRLPMATASKSPFFLSQRTEHSRWSRLFVGLLAAALSAGVFGAVASIPLLVLLPDLDAVLEEVATAPRDVLATLLLVGGLFWSAAIAANRVHRRPLRSLLAPAQPFRWGVVGKVLVLLAIGTLLSFVVSEIGLRISSTGSGDRQISFTGLRVSHVVWVIPIALATLVQTSGEDAFFKGLLLREIGAITRVFWFAPLLVAAVFTSLHIPNPDVQQDLVLILSAFLVSELVIIGLILVTGGMEIALTMHWVNNMVVFLLFAEEGTQANELTLFVTQQVAGEEAKLVTVWGVVGWATLLAVVAAGVLVERSPFYVERFTYSSPPETLGDDLVSTEEVQH